MDDIRFTTRFEVTDEHLALLVQTNVQYQDGPEFGAPLVDPKRPYGNSSVLDDMARILGIEPDDLDDYGEPFLSDEQEERLRLLHREMAVVIQILVTNLAIGVGTYVRRSPYEYYSWAPAED